MKVNLYFEIGERLLNIHILYPSPAPSFIASVRAKGVFGVVIVAFMGKVYFWAL
jgi:hypothetical protein